jgi:hypothetical protein
MWGQDSLRTPLPGARGSTGATRLNYSDPSKFVWAIGFQLTFVISLLLLAAAERLTAEKEKA